LGIKGERTPFKDGITPCCEFEERRKPWWNAISSSIREIAPVPTNLAIGRGDAASV
jgi:hypothetical protein